jgi:hypothetical protein
MPSLPPVQVDELPRSVEDFVVLRDQVAVAPQGGAAMMVLALLVYAEDEELGKQCLAATVDRRRLVGGSQGYRSWQLSNRDLQLIRMQIKGQPYLPRSYVKGTTPEHGYRLSNLPYVLEFSYNPHSGDPESGVYKVFVGSSGASSPRPVTVRRNSRGIWKASEWSSLVVGIRRPLNPEEDDV